MYKYNNKYLIISLNIKIESKCPLLKFELKLKVMNLFSKYTS